MSALITWLITALVALMLIAFAMHVVGLCHLPTAERPRTPTYDRYGRLIGLIENPDYHVSPGEDSTAEPPIVKPPDSGTSTTET